MIILPVMLQQVNGFPAIATGTLMLPRGVGLIVTMLVIGQLMNRFDARLVLVSGFALAAAANFYMSTWTTGIAPAAIMWTNFAHGCAAGGIYVPMVAIALSTLGRQCHTEAQTFMFLMMNVGKAMGVAAVFALHTRLLQVNYAVMTEQVIPDDERLRLLHLPEAWDMETTSGLAALAAEIARQADLIAYLNAFLAIGMVTLLALPLAFAAANPTSSAKTDPT
jgi:DHA2 family multidrug resistance protein